ncbi:MAG TPA: hypothetical protein VHC86_02870 [Opitutaceae bacterium]|nr:hypothetical protein [Opitutaceae bacterium]
MRATRTLLLTLGSLAGLLAGCSSNPILGGNTTVLVPIAGGQTARMTFGGGGPVLEQNADFKVASMPTLAPSRDRKHVDYDFQIELKRDVLPRSITVEDISEDPIQTLLEQAPPAMQGRKWRGQILKMDMSDKRLGWLTSLDDTVRVLRFTVVLPDGRASVVNQAVSYPGMLKALIRRTLGLNY